MSSVRFNYADVAPLTVKGKTAMKALVARIIGEEGRQLDKVNYIFCTDDFLLNINHDFLKHDDYTDIITFDLSDDTAIIGEIYISLDRVKENAATHNTSFGNELARVVFHGALHLCGYKDKKKREITIMRQKEDYYLRLFGEN